MSVEAEGLKIGQMQKQINQKGRQIASCAEGDVEGKIALGIGYGNGVDFIQRQGATLGGGEQIGKGCLLTGTQRKAEESPDRMSRGQGGQRREGATKQGKAGGLPLGGSDVTAVQDLQPVAGDESTEAGEGTVGIVLQRQDAKARSAVVDALANGAEA